MSALRILMIEDDPWAGFILEELITESVEAEITVRRSVDVVENKVTCSEFDFAFLDVHVANGKSFEIGASLKSREIPFAFISGLVHRNEVPEDLRDAPFLIKPYRRAEIRSVLEGVEALSHPVDA